MQEVIQRIHEPLQSKLLQGAIQHSEATSYLMGPNTDVNIVIHGLDTGGRISHVRKIHVET